MNKSLEQYMPDGSKLPYRFMKYRIHKILLVCCSYDGYILEEDGHIESQINQEYIDLNMVEPAVADARQLDRRGAGGAGPGRFVRFHPHDVQRRRTRSFFRSPRSSRSGTPTPPWRC